jgi:hypothetical protein
VLGRRFLSLVSLIATGSFVCLACGSRGPLDEPEYVPIEPDGGGASDATNMDALGATDATDAAMMTPVDAGRDANNPIDCAVCIGQSCSNQIIGCVTSAPCLNTLQCVFGQCLSSGQVNPTCALGCSGEGGASGILSVLAILECVTQSCGPDCDSLLAGLGSGLGGGFGVGVGGGGGGGFGGGGGIPGGK